MYLRKDYFSQQQQETSSFTDLSPETERILQALEQGRRSQVLPMTPQPRLTRRRTQHKK